VLDFTMPPKTKPPFQPGSDLLKLLIDKTNDYQRVMPGAASTTVPTSGGYKSYFLTHIDDADLDKFVAGTFKKCIITSDSGDIAKTQERVREHFSNEVKRNATWFAENQLQYVPKGTYTHDGVSVSVVQYTDDGEYDIPASSTRYRVLKSVAVNTKEYAQYKKVKNYTKNVLTRYVDVGMSEKTPVTDTLKVIKHKLGRLVAVAIERFQNQYHWYHNDITENNVFVRLLKTPTLEIQLIDFAPFSQQNAWGLPGKVTGDDFVDGTPSAFFLQHGVEASLDVPDELRKFYIQHKENFYHDRKTDIDMMCELHYLATYQIKELDGDNEYEQVKTGMVLKYQDVLRTFKRDAINSAQQSSDPDESEGGDSNSDDEDNKSEDEVVFIPEMNPTGAGNSPPTEGDSNSDEGDSDNDSVPRSNNTETKSLQPPLPAPLPLKDGQDTEETEADEIKLNKKKRPNVINSKIQQSEFNRQTESKFNTLDKKKKLLPLKNSPTDIRKDKFDEVVANKRMLLSIARVVDALSEVEKILGNKYKSIDKLVHKFENSWTTKDNSERSLIWKTSEDLGDMYNRAFTSCEVSEFTLVEQELVVAVYNLLAHISNYRAKEYVYKTDVPLEEVVFNCV
jgi:hypothetical protein